MTAVPPLRAAQVFEAVGRLGSVTAAAQELEVSSGAITQQIHVLEKFLNARLVQRHGRGIELTAWGSLYLPHVSAAMDRLRNGALELERARRTNHLVISALPSLTNKWLGPLLFEWKKAHPDAGIAIEGIDPEPRLDDGQWDFRISYGKRSRLHQRHAYLFTDFLIPIGSPTLLTGKRVPVAAQDLLGFPRLWIEWGPEFPHTPTWSEWFDAAGVRHEPLRRDLTFSLSSAAIDAAVAGHGLVLAQHSMVVDLLASGALRQFSNIYVPLPQEYFLAWNSSTLDKPLGAAFRDWMRTAARRFECPTSLAGRSGEVGEEQDAAR